MHLSTVKETAAGATLATIAFMLALSSFPLQPVAAASDPLFSMTLLAPTSNPVRRQWAAIISNSYQSANIDAKLVYVSFGTLVNHMFTESSPTLYANGGFDAGFVGFGGGSVLPDFGTNNVINYRSNNYPPNGQNYYFYKNATYDSLADQYANAFDPAARVKIGQQMVRIVAQDRPALIIDYPAEVFAWTTPINPWNQQATYSPSTTGLDVQHFAVKGDSCAATRSCVLNTAETGDINSVDAVATSTSNTLYDRYLYGITSANLEELDIRSLNYFKAIATSITSSSDHLTWTVKFTAHNFQDGVPVTADDYLFTILAQNRADSQGVALGTFQTILGLNTQYTFLNGTTDYAQNGTYFHKTAPSGWTPSSTFTSINATAFTFHMSTAYVFTDPVVTGIAALPMHIYEKIPTSQWGTSFLGSLQKTPTTVTWNKAQYGGNGSYAWAYGPVGDGPYVYKGYDIVAGVGTLVRFDGYWNATGLQALGEFNIKTIHVDFIAGKDAAIAAFKNGQVNFLDSQYTFNKDDISTISTIGGVSAVSVDPSAGWQEMGLNMGHLVFGTGTGTPLGTSNPSQAAFAARQVRKALSYLVPRQFIIKNLLQGLAQPGITQVCSCFGAFYPSDIHADPYDPTAAKSFLAAAGYQTGVAPPQTGGTITFPPIPQPPPITVNVSGTVVTIPVKVPNFTLGSSFTVSGNFVVDPVLASTSNGFAVILQQSLNNGTTWKSVAIALTTPGTASYSITYVPTTKGFVQYRVLFTGIPETYVATTGISNATLLQQNLRKDFGGLVPNNRKPANVTQPAYGPVTRLQVGTLADVITQIVKGIAQVQQASTTEIKTAVTSLATQVNSNVNQLTGSLKTLSDSTASQLSTLTGNLNTLNANAATKSDLSTLSGQVTALSNNVSTLTTVAYAGLIIAIVLGLIAIGLALRKRS